MPSKSPLIKVFFLFMAGIILPTSFLAYLGVMSLRSETLLLRKESQERVGKTAQAIEDQLQSIIGSALEPFAAAAQAVGAAEKSAFSNATLDAFRHTNPAIQMLVLTDAENHLLYPARESRRRAIPPLPPLPPELRRRWEQAEQSEFKDHDYAGALKEYRAAERAAESPRWKSILLTSAAGTLVKLKQYDSAETQYQEILSRYSSELDSGGYPFGLVIASQLADLQEAKGRSDLAVGSRLRVFQDIVAARWDLSWEEVQFFARHETQRIENLKTHMNHGDQARWQALQSQWELLKTSVKKARDFMSGRWPAVQRILREEDRTGRPYLVFSDSHAAHAIGYAPAYEARTDQLQVAVIADFGTEPLISRLNQTARQLAAASNLAYRLELQSGTLVGASEQKPEGKRWPVSSQLSQSYPALRLMIAPLTDVPVEHAAARRRQVYLGIVVLAGVVVLIALFATWYAVSREIEVAQLKSRFVASMSHELKTPLSIIDLVGQKLKLGRYSSQTEADEYYGMLTDETERLKSMIDDVLDFSRLLDNRQPYRKESADLSDIIRDSIERCRQSQPNQTLDIQFTAAPGNYILPMDREAMNRVVMNLLENAIKYSPPDRLSIHISLRQEGNAVIFEVQDRGFGIPPDEQKLVFERFYRGKSALIHQQTKGVGLGLSIVQHIVNAHTGTVELRSKEGHGSTFIVRLPTAGDL